MPRLYLLAFALAAFLLGTPTAAPAQSAEALFDDGVLHDVQLFVHSRDLQELRDRIDENVFFPADLHWRGLRVRNVGVRARGGASRSAVKPGLVIQFDRYTTGQRFLGLRTLVLDNLGQDPALVREPVAMAFFNLMGQPAPRESFCRMYINHVYHGVYAIVEDIEPGFLERTLGDSAGYLFEFRVPATPFHGEDLGDDVTAYKALLEARTHRLESDSVLYAPLRELFREINQDDSLWRDRVDAYLDVGQFVTQAAIETFLSELDGLIGYWGMNNFYLYRPAGSDRHRVIPWDKDRAFYDITSGIFQRAEDNELFRRALRYDDLRAHYLDTLERCAEAAAREDWLVQKVARAAALVVPEAYRDQLKPYTNEELDAAIAFVARFARERSAFVQSQVETARRNPSNR